MKKNKPVKILPLIVSILIVGLIVWYVTRKILNTLVILCVLSIVYGVYVTAKGRLYKSRQIKMIESVFPDFLQLVGSNLKAGITIDRAMVISSRKEFYPLDEHINQLGRDLVTGKQIGIAMKEMAEHINSEKITKTINLIITGMKSGGDLAILLEQTAVNMRERDFVEKRAASNVLMYIILIFFAVAIGAPGLFSLSTVLVSVLKQILSNVPATPTTVSLPFALTNINISTEFVTYFAIIFLLTIDILGSMVVGLVQKGDEKEGLKYAIPMAILSISVFLIIKAFLANYFAGIIG